MTDLALTLAAISSGAVFMGALSYIGNAPNFMVYAIAVERGIRMPSFFGYMAWSFLILLPLFGLLTLFFFTVTERLTRAAPPISCNSGLRFRLMTEPTFVPHIYFGIDPMLASTVILIVTYAAIMTEKINRAVVALIGAALMVFVGALDQTEALEGIDWNTIGLLTGMMILVSISRRSGMFQYLAIWSAQKARANPAGILLLLQITTALLSALLDNVTTVLLVVPVTLVIARN